ncbi:glycosyltransferase family 9 protein [bacterium]|nr:glycosyltransferase family 9 protein [bacterium]
MMKLLIVKLHALGDLVIATPAIRRLRTGLKYAQIDLLTTKWSAPAMEGNPNLDRLIVVDDAIFFNPGIGTFIPTVRLIGKLRREKYDAAVIFHQHRFIKMFVRMTGISRRFSFGEENNKSVRRHPSAGRQRSVRLDESRHSALTAWELADLTVRELGGDPVEPPLLEELRYEWFVQTGEAERAEKILNDVGITVCHSERSEESYGDFAVILPGGGVNPSVKDTVRRWSSEKFRQLAMRIMDEFDLRIILLGGGSDIVAAQEVSGDDTTGIINHCGKHNLRLSAAIMKKSRFVVSNDTGPLHIAAAVNVPVVGIFGPTGIRLKLPPGERSYAASLKLPCSPCYFGVFKACIFDSIRCLEELDVETVMTVVRHSIRSGGARKRGSEETRELIT